MSMLVARQNGQTRKQVVLQPRVERRCNLDPAERQTVRFPDARNLFLRQPIEFIDQLERCAGSLRNEKCRGFHAESNRRSGGLPQKPSDHITSMALRRRAIE